MRSGRALHAGCLGFTVEVTLTMLSRCYQTANAWLRPSPQIKMRVVRGCLRWLGLAERWSARIARPSLQGGSCAVRQPARKVDDYRVQAELVRSSLQVDSMRCAIKSIKASERSFPLALRLSFLL